MKKPRFDFVSKFLKSQVVLSKSQRIELAVFFLLTITAVVFFYFTRNIPLTALIIVVDLGVVFLIEFIDKEKKTTKKSSLDKREFFLMIFLEIDYSHDVSLAYGKALDELPISTLKTKLDETREESIAKDKLLPLKDESNIDLVLLIELLEEGMEQKRRIDANYLADYERLYRRVFKDAPVPTIETEVLVLLIFSFFLLIIISGIISCL